MARTTTRDNAIVPIKKRTTRKANVRHAKKDSRAASPLREVLAHMTGKKPPKFVRGYTLEDLTEDECWMLQRWAVNNVKPSWLTGIGLLEAAEQQVMEAVSNGNIEPPKESSRAAAIRRTLERLRQRQFEALDMLEKCVVKEALDKVSFMGWTDKVVDMGLFSRCLCRALNDPDVLPEFDRLTGYDLCMKRPAIEQAIDKATGYLDAGIETFLHFVVDAIYLPVQKELLEISHEK